MTTLEKIRAEIEQIADEEQKHDEKWAIGLRYAVKIIDKYAEQEPTDKMVHVETLHQVMWERDIAIEQLKELGYGLGQKIEPCDDAVSRQAVKDLFCRICMENNICYRSKDTCEDLKLFDQLPSVRPQESKTGKWIEHHNQTRFYFKCSNCKTLHNEKSNYCPFCGTRMNGDYKGLTKIVIGENDVI